MTARVSLASFTLPLAILCLGNAAFAADASAPIRAARLTYVQGSVSVVQAGNAANIPAQLNQPLLTGVQVTTADDGQAEIEFEDGSVVRVTPNSAVSLDNLTTDSAGVFTTNLSLLHGLAYLELRATPQFHYAVNAGGDVLSPVENSTVRVSFDQPPATFAVLDGTARVERQNGESTVPGYQSDVRAGETLRADPNDPTRYSLTQEIAEDSWDQWNEDLDKSAATEASDRTGVRDNYAGPQGYGWSDLDANGDWYDVPGQGPVWQPDIAADDSDFDPYGNGAWVANSSTGYLWASGYTWGWTPYRCGTWSYFGGFGWGWAPGAGCGGAGWGFAGAGVPVNILIGPNGYRPIRVPLPGPRPVRPVRPIHPIVASQRMEPSAPTQPGGTREIGGVLATRIKPAGNAFVSSDAPVGSSLQRDYPIDSATQTPILGLASTRPAIVHTHSNSRSAGQPSAASHPSYTGQSRPAPASVYPQTQRTVQQAQPVQRYSPPPPPPPAPHPASPPPAAPASHSK